MKNQVYAIPVNNRILDTYLTVREKLSQDRCQKQAKRARACIKEDGEHFENKL